MREVEQNDSSHLLHIGPHGLIECFSFQIVRNLKSFKCTKTIAVKKKHLY